LFGEPKSASSDENSNKAEFQPVPDDDDIEGFTNDAPDAAGPRIMPPNISETLMNPYP
jgi:hypothetical protein